MKQFVLIPLLFIFSFSHAQVKVDYELSDKLKDTKFTQLTSSAVSHDGKRIMIIKSMPKLLGKNKQRLQMLDENMKMITDREVRDIRYISIISMKERSFFLCATDEGELFMKEIDETTMKEKGEKLKILQMEKTRMGMGLGKYFSYPSFSVSQDSTKLAFLITDDVKKNEIQSYATAVYDQNVSKLWGKRFNVGMKDKDYKLTDTRVGNDGAIYLSGVELTGKRVLSSNEFNKVQIQRIKGDQRSKYKVDLDDDKRYLGELELMDSNSNESGIDILAFMYTPKIGLSHILTAQLDENLNVVSKKMNEVSFKDFITDENDKKKDKTKEGKKGNSLDQRSLKIRHISRLKDDNMLVVAEQHSVETYSSYNSNSGWTTHTTYYYLDVVAFKFDSTGDLLWAKKVAKKQSGSDHSSFGVSVYQGGENLYLLFNDSEKNGDPERTKLYRYGGSFKKGIYKVNQINIETGVSKEDVVFDLSDKGLYIEPKNYYQMGNGSLILMGFKKKDRAILKMKFPEN